MRTIRASTAMNEKERSEALFNGDLVLFSIADALAPFIRRTKDILNASYGVNDPAFAHQVLEISDFQQRANQAQQMFGEDESAKQLLLEALSACGLDPMLNYYDKPLLRIVPASTAFDNGRQASISHHRDTWGSNISCQQNWWLPIYPLENTRSITLYPSYWDTPVRNTTSTWSLDAYLKAKKQAVGTSKIDYPSAPQAVESINESGCFTPHLAIGEILCFSSAHLHGSASGPATRCRFSVEVRTIHLSDVAEKRGAPNVDNASLIPMYQWFKRMNDDKKLVFN